MTDAVLVTGGAGFIGSHTCKALAESGWRPVVFDNLSAGRREAVRWGDFIHGDIRDGKAMREAMRRHEVAGVIHFAALTDVGRSMARPDLFWDQNVNGTTTLLAAMRDVGVRRLVFSSSAAVYGEALSGTPVTEDAPRLPLSVYGDTKLAGERAIEAHCRAFGVNAFALRYFNAGGADSGGLIGQADEAATHLIPLALDAALGRGGPLTVFGRDFDTPDGSGVRDYVHVSDLARAHVAALGAAAGSGAFHALNVGTGVGCSVMQVIAAVERALGRAPPYVIGPRRAGDPASLVADARLIARTLNWSPRDSSLDNIVATAARWRRSLFAAAEPRPVPTPA